MDELFEVIFRNPFIILLIIGWLFATFREKPKKEQQQGQRQKQQRQRPPGQVGPQRQARRQPPHNERDVTHTESQGKPLGRVDVEQKPVVISDDSLEQPAIEDQQLEQLEQLQNRLGAHVTDLDDMEDVPSTFQQHAKDLQPKSKKKMKQSTSKTELTKRFNKRGLVESIIMAEVLGKPRSKRMNHRNHL